MATSINLRPARVSDDVHKSRLEFAGKLEKQLENDVPWWDFPSPEEYRKARREGTNGFKKPVLNEKARLITTTGRDGQSIELRVIEPSTKASKGVWLHFHAGTIRSCFCVWLLVKHPSTSTRKLTELTNRRLRDWE